MIMTAVESSVFCKTCEYELTGTLENRCPECARPFDPGTPETYEVMPGHRRRKRQYLVATAFALLVIVMLFEGIRRYEPWLTYIAVLIGGPGLIALFLGIHLRRSTPNPLLTLLAVAPSALLLGLFYSLAVHMHQTLGGFSFPLPNKPFNHCYTLVDTFKADRGPPDAPPRSVPGATRVMEASTRWRDGVARFVLWRHQRCPVRAGTFFRADGEPVIPCD